MLRGQRGQEHSTMQAETAAMRPQARECRQPQKLEGARPRLGSGVSRHNLLCWRLDFNPLELPTPGSPELLPQSQPSFGQCREGASPGPQGGARISVLSPSAAGPAQKQAAS